MPTSLEHASEHADARTFTPATVAEAPLADYRPWPPGLPEEGRARDSLEIGIAAIAGIPEHARRRERVRELLRGPRGFCG